jgi:hypothetical protein
VAALKRLRVLIQETNACAVLPESQWSGHRATYSARTQGAWGTPPMPPALAQAALEGDPATRRTAWRPPWRG